MNKLKKFINKTKNFFIQKPALCVPVAAVTAFLIFGTIESIRAFSYINSAKDYKNSLKILELQESVTMLNESLDKYPAAVYCEISTQGLLSGFNEAYSGGIEESKKPEVIIDKLHQQIETAKPAPAFSSLMDFLPQPKKARAESESMNTALKELNLLTRDSPESTYCLELVEALTRTYFLQDLQKPEGVAALFVGQIENFQVNNEQAREILLNMKFPTTLESEHTELVALYDKIALDLREDENRYTQFARRMEADVAQLDSLLLRISDKTSDLQTRPRNITIQVNELNNN